MEWLQSLVPNIENLGVFGYWLVLLAALSESLVLVGVFVPGAIIVVFAGFLSSRGYLDLGDLVWFAAIGAVVGDSLSYYLGTKGTHLFRAENRVLKTHHLELGQRFFRKHGSKSVFLGRFIGLLRPIVPFVAGLSGMRMQTFLVWNVASAVLWAGLHLLLGYFFGSAFSAIEVWTTRAGYVVGLIAIFIVLLYGVRWVVVARGRDVTAFVGSVSRSVGTAIATNPDVQRLAKRHPRFVVFTRSRLDRASFSGLPLTLLAIGFVYILSLFLGIIQDVLSANVVVAADLRIANLFVYFRTRELTSAFLWVTLLGSWPVVVSTALAASIGFWLWRKMQYIPYLWLALIVEQAFAYVGKLAFHRARPENSVYVESSFSFPSGHAMVAVVLYGFIAYVLIRHARSWPKKVNAFFVWVVVALAIGLSRLYLAVHYVSDVWAGYLLGALILTTVIALQEWWRGRSAEVEAGPMMGTVAAKWATFGLALAGLAFSIVVALRFPPPLVAPAAAAVMPINGDVGAYFVGRRDLQYSETLLGNPAEPLGFIFLAADDEALKRSFDRASWFSADTVSVESVARIARAALLRSPYPTAPMTPAFWNAQVNEFGFQIPTSADNVSERHHIRIWKTNLRQGDLAVYVGTASLDVGLKWFVTHRISPDIDTERAFVKDSLESAGVVARLREMQLVDPVLGTNFAEDAFFTNGKLYVIVLK